jgi:predicted XRE-type DNA-binding protein
MLSQNAEYCSDPDRLLTLKQVATILGVTKVRVNHLVQRKELNAQLHGHMYLTRVSDVLDYIQVRKPVGRPRKECI